MFRWFKKREKKSSGYTEFLHLGNASWFSRSYQSLAREGYEKNIIAYHCIKSIADACASIPFDVKINDDIIESPTHPIVQLLKRPNPRDSYETFIRDAISYRLISGNIYILGNVVSTGRVMELTLLRPDRVTIETTTFQEPRNYIYQLNGQVFRYPIDPITYQSDVLHIKEFHPLDDLYGLSPLSAAALGIGQHNESAEWNKRLLENSARPPGLIAIKDRGDGAPAITQGELERLKSDFDNKYAGYKNAGSIPFLSWEVEWKSMGLSPTDMDWINSRQVTAREICLAFKYPPMLLGFPEGATFNNMSEAKLSLYEDTVIPLIQNVHAELSNYLMSTGKIKNLEICADLDQVPALSARRETARKNARDDVNAGLITINEAREEMGYDPIQGGDEILVPAQKLPLNFDVGNLSQDDFKSYLLQEGFNMNFAERMAKLTYVNK